EGDVRMSVPSIPDRAAAQPPPWGYLATLGWVLLAAALGFGVTMAGFLAWLMWEPELALADATELAGDARALAFLLTTMALVVCAVLAFAARQRRWSVSDYLGLVPPDGRQTMIAIGLLVVTLVVVEGLTWVAG